MRVYIVDDDQGIVDTLTYTIKRLGHEVLAFTLPEAFIEAAPQLESGCVILDYSMPELDGLAVQKRLGEMKAAHTVILLTGVGDIPEAVTAMRAGAVDFLRKPFRQAALSEALVRAEEKLATQERFIALERLTSREREVLIALASGMSSKIVAHELGISVRTVEMHRGSLVKKLGVPNTGAALVLAQQGGLLPSSA